MKTYQTTEFNKFVEEDDYKEGCLSENSSYYDTGIKFKSNNLNKLIEKIKDFFDIKTEYIEFNSCEDKGRIDIGLTENADGEKPNKEEVKQWKKGKIKLYYCLYSAYIQEVKDVNLKRFEE